MNQSRRPLLAILLRLGAMVLFATLMMVVKYIGEAGIAVPEMIFWRQAVPTVLLLTWFAARGKLGTLRTSRARSHFLRTFVGMIGMIGMLISVTHLHLAESTTLSFTAPLFAVVIAALVMREHVGIWRWSAVALGFCGVLVIARPGVADISTIGTAAGLFSGLVLAIVNFQIRDLGRTESSICIVFYFSLFGTLFAALLAPFFVSAHSPYEWFLLVSLGVLGAGSQFLIAASLRFAPVMSVIVIDYTLLIWSTLYGWLIWNDLPSWTTWIGAPAIIVASLTIVWRENRLARPIPPIGTSDSVETEGIAGEAKFVQK